MSRRPNFGGMGMGGMNMQQMMKQAKKLQAQMAQEQENIAKTQEMRAKVVEAQSQVPEALAEAFRNGKIGVMDYYNMQNIQADTKMRESLSEGDSEHNSGDQ